MFSESDRAGPAPVAPASAATAVACLALAYPLLAHLALHYRSTVLTLAAALALALAALWRGLGARQRGAWLALGLVVAALLGLAALHLELLPLYLPPVLVNLFLAWFFGRTLGRGGRPLIERLVWHLHDRPSALEPALRAYTRRLTWIWAAFFTCVAILDLVLALLAHPDGVLELLGLRNPLPLPQAWWFWFCNVLNFVVAALLMGLEFAYRRHRFPEHRERNRSLPVFLRRMRATLPAIWRDLIA